MRREMVAVKIFRVEGEIHSPNYHTTFSKDLRALKPEDAIEKVLMEFGSRHNVKRVHVNIAAIKEITAAETNDPLIKVLSER